MTSALPDPACCVELNITVFAGQYQASLQVDGTVRQRLVLQTECEVIDWAANAMLCSTGYDLYIHLRAGKPRLKQVALELACKLSRQDVMIGIIDTTNGLPNSGHAFTMGW